MGIMLPRLATWSLRALVFTVVGVLTFLVQPPGATALTAQLVGYLLAGLGLLAWALADTWPRVARYRARALPVILGVIAVAAGFACTAGRNENNCPVMLASMATLGAGPSAIPGMSSARLASSTSASSTRSRSASGETSTRTLDATCGVGSV